MGKLIKVRKGNRAVTIDENVKKSYLKQGYDVIDPDSGEVLERATGGRVVSLAEHYKVVDALERLKADNGHDYESDIVELKKEIASLKGENTKLKKAAENK